MGHLTNKDFYYCYSPVLFKYLYNKNIKYICVGLAENTQRKFWQYERTEELKEALEIFKNNKPVNKENAQYY